MKLFKTVLLAMAGIVGLAACNTMETSPMEMNNESKLSIEISTGYLTKASDPLQVNDDEARIKDAQIYIFKEDGSLYRKIDTAFASNPVGQAVRKEANINANESYRVAVFVNGASANPKVIFNDVQKIEDLRNKVVYLASSNPEQGCFAMYGETADAIRVGVNQTASAAVTVTRFVSRIRLMSIQNKLPEAYGKLTIDEAFIINAMSKWDMKGSMANNKAASFGKFNWAGRKWGQSTSVVVTDFIRAAADCQGSGPDANTMYPYGKQTYKAYSGVDIDNYNALVSAQDAAADTKSTHKFEGDNGDRFYVFPNTCASDAATGSSMSDTFKGPMALGTDTDHNAPSRIVIRAHFNNTNDNDPYYYYPVTVPAMERNKTYDVKLIISGFGSKDPNMEPAKGSIETTITVAPWAGASEINQEI